MQSKAAIVLTELHLVIAELFFRHCYHNHPLNINTVQHGVRYTGPAKRT